jgi:hypothetical protein
LIGMVRIQVTQASGTAPAFVGIAPADAAARYLAGVDYATVHGAAGHHGPYTEQAGSAPAEVNVAATLPALPWIATGLLIGGILLIVIPLPRASGH